MKTVLYYDAEQNPGGAFLPGVPLRDLTDEDLARLPAHLQRSVGASPLYRKTKPKTAPALPADPPAAEEG